MDEKSIEILEFPRIKEIIAAYASFSVSRALLLNLQPLTDYDEISFRLRQTSEGRVLIQTDPDFSIGGVRDIRDSVKMAKLGKTLETENLLDVQATLGAFRHIKQSARRVPKELSLIMNIVDNIVELPAIENDINSCIAPNGEILDQASNALSKIRSQLNGSRAQLTERLRGIISSTKWQNVIQEPIITEREGRYVIPVKIEQRREMKGIVHDVSNTGVTAFIEPWATVELGNTVRELVIQEEREIERILNSLSEKIGGFHDEIQNSIRLVAELDTILAKARYAQRTKASEPELLASSKDHSTNNLRLVSARHPLLADKAVPMTIEMGRDYSVLVITGPNTGGKTVALKTIGLLSLMVHAGLPIPAAPESVIPVFDNIFADIGDEQSIAQTLSTFSWHISNIVRILSMASVRSLVLMDELGTNTDPVEGSALARALLKYFLDHKMLTVITSHFNELKAYVHQTPGMVNASLDFDPVTLKPTYHLTVGVPGGSNALATASRLGLPDEIVAEARTMLSDNYQEIEELLTDLTRQKMDLNILQQELSSQKRNLEDRNHELELEIKRVKTEEQRVIVRTRDEIMTEAASLFRELRSAATDLRKEKTKENIEAARAVLKQTKERMNLPAWQIQKDIPDLPEQISAGDIVWLKDTNLAATVIFVSEETHQVQLEAGQTKLTVSLDAVEKRVGDHRTDVRQYYDTVKFDSVKKKVPLELDLRGKRADEVEPLLDAYLNDASVAKKPFVRIVHGWGTGTVKEITRSFVSRHPLVKSFRPGGRDEGGDGATVINL